MIEEHDAREIYCRKLGHYVRFGYCRRVQGVLPCGSLPNCWGGRLDVGGFLRDHYTPEQLEQTIRPPAPKIASILELVERARRAG